MIAKTAEGHKHKFTVPVEQAVAVRRVVNERGRTERDTMTARDILKQRKCVEKIAGEEVCGAVETYDMQRKKI